MSYVLNPYRFAAADSDYIDITSSSHTVTSEGNWSYLKFTGDGSFSIASFGSDDGSNTFEYMTVAGGGGGAESSYGGGAGAGEVYHVTSYSPNSSYTDYAVVVGAGGAAVTDNLDGNNGSDSWFREDSDTEGKQGEVSGGGGTTKYTSFTPATYDHGQSGGSGAGSTGNRYGTSAYYYLNTAGGTSVKTQTNGLGNNGGAGAGGYAQYYGGGGGGGAGGVGESTTSRLTDTTFYSGSGTYPIGISDGGIAYFTSSFDTVSGGEDGYYGGGGGASTAYVGVGDSTNNQGKGNGGSSLKGGGGDGYPSNSADGPEAGLANTGGGAGGGGAASYPAASGGSGAVLMKWKTSDDYIEAEGGTVTTSGDYKLHTFTGDGGFTITNAGTADGSNTFDYAVYGGGAGGGSGSGAGGGGGGYRTATGISSSETTVAVTVGAGGAGNTDQSAAGSNGSASSYAQAGSQEFYDVSTNGHTITTAGNTAYDTTTKKIGNASIDFDGTGDYLSVAASTDFEFGSGDPFTVEMWAYITDTSTNNYLFNLDEDSSGDQFAMAILYDGNLWTGIDGVVAQYTVDLSALEDSWHHFAFVGTGSAREVYLDGTELTLASGSATQPATGTLGNLMIGTYDGSSHELTGYLDQIRISNVARYLADFTPVEEPFVVDSNTKLLIEPTYTAAGVSIISAGGGGGGGTYDVDDGDGTSSADGSGGGASTYFTDDTYSGAGGTGGSYGNDGGVASVAEGDSGYYLYPNGGGGGAGGAGGDASYSDSTFSGGDGGIGAKPSWLTNLRGGGGGGGCDSDIASSDVGQGGTGYGGGGDGGCASDGGDGTANYGAGGGGGSYDYDGDGGSGLNYDGGDGGSGIVVFRYKYK